MTDKNDKPGALLRIYAGLLAIYGLLLAMGIIYLAFTGQTEAQGRTYTGHAIIFIALVMFLLGYVSVRRITFGAVKLL